ncbi:MAG: hypothetical protein AUK35_07275 [Zetaproteobacteria bacterium CG2_30_46_52]|nr:MAG: hypothetical protein AUK35_07275 [Zetaproteobacteria bacterium CG2_30_46_52]
MQQHQLPEQYLDMVQEYVMQLAGWISQQKGSTTLVVGINGAQGSGKTTLSGVLAIILAQHGYEVAQLSIDDLYLSKVERLNLATNVHALFATRGVPGTHHVQLCLDIIQQFKSGIGFVRVPRFDKGIDDSVPEAAWYTYDLPVDIVLLEGWCVGIPPQQTADLLMPINELEAKEDQEGVWRGFVNHALTHTYQELFQHIDVLVYLQVPSFDSVFLWRQLQEVKLFRNQQGHGDCQKAMTADELQRFIQHYERLSRWAMQTLPLLADVVIALDDSHHISKISYKNTE